MSLFPLITSIGLRPSHDAFQRRTIILTNSVALTFLTAYILLLIGRVLIFEQPLDHRIVLTLAIFSSPLVINHFGYIRTAQIFLAWSPVLSVYYNFISVLTEQEVITTTIYDALKIFLLGFAPVPFLVFNTQDKKLFAIGISFSLLGTLFADQIMDFFHVGPAYVSGVESEIRFNSFRTIISYIAVAGSCFTIRYIVDRADALNQKLIQELHEKNEIIRRQADSELSQLNQQLMANLEELTQSEFFLKKAQKTAKVGSWQFNPKSGSMLWSDEMYEIFEVKNGYGANRAHANALKFPESAEIIKKDFLHLMDQTNETDVTVQLRTSNGSKKWLKIQGYPAITNGDCTSVSGIVHDITYFKESEERILATEQNYRSLFEQASDLIMITDLNGKFVDMNSSMCKTLGYEREELLKLTIGSLIDPDQLRENPIRFKELLEGAHVINERLMIHKDGTRIPVEVNVKKFGDQYLMAIARDVRDRKKTRHLLNERLKELSTLYSVSQLLSSDVKVIEEVLEEIPDIITQGWQYPDICVSSLRVFDKVYESRGYRESRWFQKALLFDDQHEIGFLEVAYLEEKPPEHEGPFFIEERNLINTLAEMIQIYLKRKHDEQARTKAQANLKATINNTEIYIWSLDSDFNLLTFNDQFAQFVKTHLGVTVREGANHRALFPQDLVPKWEERYKRALTGEIVTQEETSFGMDFRFSLSPIIENGKVTGVSVFADNVTEDNIRARELEEANRKINEHKIMALRSVMNPHFIFNVLSSIQYFITRNDQFNAINYLTSFSKLMRTVLTRSVADRISLKEELEMLKDYINLEKLRFEEKFVFHVEHEPDLDVEAIRIPSLLIQPYVENAILHGLYNKDGIGTLTLRVKTKGVYLIFEIEDDGVGREAASRLNIAKDPKRKSMGTALTEERLKLINQDSEVAVTYTDLVKNSSPSGTLVQIRIKLEE